MTRPAMSVDQLEDRSTPAKLTMLYTLAVPQVNTPPQDPMDNPPPAQPPSPPPATGGSTGTGTGSSNSQGSNSQGSNSQGDDSGNTFTVAFVVKTKGGKN